MCEEEEFATEDKPYVRFHQRIEHQGLFGFRVHIDIWDGVVTDIVLAHRGAEFAIDEENLFQLAGVIKTLISRMVDAKAETKEQSDAEQC